MHSVRRWRSMRAQRAALRNTTRNTLRVAWRNAARNRLRSRVAQRGAWHHCVQTLRRTPPCCATRRAACCAARCAAQPTTPWVARARNALCNWVGSVLRNACMVVWFDGLSVGATHRFDAHAGMCATCHVHDTKQTQTLFQPILLEKPPACPVIQWRSLIAKAFDVQADRVQGSMKISLDTRDHDALWGRLLRGL